MSSNRINTKSRILEVTWRLLESGNKAIRMADIAKAAGVSRQALYLHFPSRAELLVATTRHIDKVKNVDARLARSRSASSGVERLHAFVDAWGGYIPQIHGISVALRAMRDTDKEAAAAWEDRMQAVRQGCEAAVLAILQDGYLKEGITEITGVDLLWTLLSVENWERLVLECGWSQSEYEQTLKKIAEVSLMSQR
ncbi:MAG TPA: TetR/AcrR family transcriptional regulator [Rhodobacteraceae bacterium]|nr:TetR/AcrR family transcriptional regulator [Paracoccaceae bacterium]